MGDSASPDGGRHTFPQKLFEIVEDGPPQLIDWNDDGMSFRVLNEPLFSERILPQHFAHAKMASFQRQLNIYGFRRVLKVRARHP
jgi:hypothetical protein